MPYSVILARPSSRTARGGFIRFARDFYSIFPHDHGLTISGPLVQLPSNSILELLKKLKLRHSNDILVVSHANPNGLALSIHSRKVQWCAMAMLLHYARIERAYQAVKNKTDPKAWYQVVRFATQVISFRSAQQAYRSVTVLGKSPFSQEFKDEVKKMGKAAVLNNCRSSVEKRLKYFKRELGMPSKTLNSYLKELRAVHRRGRINNLEIRGCNIGGKPFTLRILGLFFNVKRISGIDVVDMFGMSRVTVHGSARSSAFQRALRRYKRRRTTVYYKPAGLPKYRNELLFVRHRLYPEIIAERAKIVEKFFVEKFGVPMAWFLFAKVMIKLDIPHTGRTKLPVHFLDTRPILFPNDKGFRRHIKRVSIVNPFSI